MPGSICDGSGEVPTGRESVAYCEGRLARAAAIPTMASGATGVEGDDNGLTWTSKVGGDGMHIILTDPLVGSEALAVSVVSQLNDILVMLGTADTAAFETGVEGNDNGVTWTPVGEKRVFVALIDPSAIDQELALLVTGNQIDISLATDGAGDITSTATEVIAAAVASAAAALLVTPTDTGASSGAAAVVAETGESGDIDSTAAAVLAAIEAEGTTDAIVGLVDTGGSSGLVEVVAEVITLTGGTNPHEYNSDDSAAYERGVASKVAAPTVHGCCAPTGAAAT